VAIALSLPTLAVSREESDLIDWHLDRLAKFNRANAIAEAYFEGRQRVRDLGISIPPSLRTIEVVVGWPGTTLEALEERLDWMGWTSSASGDPFGLDEVYLSNGLDVEASLLHVDALLYGVGYAIVGAGEPGEPNPLVTVESARNVTGAWDGRLRRLSSAVSVDDSRDGHVTRVTLYLPDQNVRVGRPNRWSRWQVIDRDVHNLGRVQVVAFPNRPRASREGGRSEITRAVRAYTDTAVRTLLGMEVNREFYSAPQRYALGVDEGAFVKADGTAVTGWEAVMGRMLALPRDEDGELPQVGQFSPASPAPYLAQVEGLAKLLAAEAGIPADYLGVVSQGNPSSADAIRAMEARLVKRAERRQSTFGRGWREVAALSILVREGEIPAEFSAVGNRWRDAATPTRAAAADEAVKLVGAGILPPDSQVTLDRLGITPQEQRILESDRRRAQAQTRIAALGAAAEAARQTPGVADAEASRDEVA
jgi:hypothetical protein